jgi:hypothetical protein
MTACSMAFGSVQRSSFISSHLFVHQPASQTLSIFISLHFATVQSGLTLFDDPMMGTNT